MTPFHRPSHPELMEAAARVLRARLTLAERLRDSALPSPAHRTASPPPPAFGGDPAAREARRQRSLQCCHWPLLEDAGGSPRRRTAEPTSRSWRRGLRVTAT
jgi:hypothetical protein